MASQMSTSSMLTSSRKSTCSEMRAATLSVAGREKSSLDSYAPSKSNMLCRVLAPTSVPSTSIFAAAMPRKALCGNQRSDTTGLIINCIRSRPVGAHAFAFLSFKRHHKNKLVNQGRSESAMGRRLHTMEGC